MLDDLRKAIGRLIAAYEQEKETRKELEGKVSSCLREIEDSRKRITELERQIDNLKIKNAFLMSPHSRTEAKERLDRMIREIDRCISLLEK